MNFSVWTQDNYDDKELVEILGIRSAVKGQIVSYRFTETEVRGEKHKILVVWDTTLSAAEDMPTSQEISKAYAQQLKEIEGDEELAATTQVLEELCEKLNINEAMLDEAVHEIVSQQASDINNEGLGGQLTFLLKALGGEKDLRDWLKQTANADD